MSSRDSHMQCNAIQPHVALAAEDMRPQLIHVHGSLYSL